jgi:hypothetical protein
MISNLEASKPGKYYSLTADPVYRYAKTLPSDIISLQTPNTHPEIVL